MESGTCGYGARARWSMKAWSRQCQRVVSWTIDAESGGASVRNAYGSALRRWTPSRGRISNLYRSPGPTSGMKSSQMPVDPMDRMGCRRPSQELKSPTTETERAVGAQTANKNTAHPTHQRGGESERRH